MYFLFEPGQYVRKAEFTWLSADGSFWANVRERFELDEQQLHLDIVTNVLLVVQSNVQRMHIINSY